MLGGQQNGARTCFIIVASGLHKLSVPKRQPGSPTVRAESPLEMSGPIRFNTCIRAGTNHKATSAKTSKKSRVPRTAMTVVLLSSLGAKSYKHKG